MSTLPDLQAFEIQLQNQDGPLPIAAVRARSLNGMFHTEIGRRHTVWVDSLHDPKRNLPSPFSLVTLFRDGYLTGFRVATLTEEAGQIISEVWGSLAARGATIRLGSANLRITGIRPGKPGACTYAALLENAPAAYGVHLRFETPVRLKFHDMPLLLPIPRAVWHSYIERWEAFSTIPLPPEIQQWVEYRVIAKEVTLETRFAYMEKTVAWKGVMGEVLYQANTKSNEHIPASRLPDYLRAWQALARLAEFTGTGSKTTMGMGRTRCLRAFGTYRPGEDSEEEEE